MGGKRVHSPLSRVQVRRVIRAIRQTFPHLRDRRVLPEFWQRKNSQSKIESEGFCFAATNALYHMLGGKAVGLTPMVAAYIKSGERVSHWWLRDQDGTYYDPTQDQYTEHGVSPPYSLGHGAGFNRPLTTPTLAGMEVIKLASDFLAREGFGPNGLPTQ